MALPEKLMFWDSDLAVGPISLIRMLQMLSGSTETTTNLKAGVVTAYYGHVVHLNVCAPFAVFSFCTTKQYMVTMKYE